MYVDGRDCVCMLYACVCVYVHACESVGIACIHQSAVSVSHSCLSQAVHVPRQVDTGGHALEVSQALG